MPDFEPQIPELADIALENIGLEKSDVKQDDDE